MMKHIVTATIAAAAFILGIAADHMTSSARAAAAPLAPAAIDLTAISPDDMPPPSAIFPNLRSKTLVVADGMTAALSIGTAPKHYHSGANEIQVILDGTGTEWLGDRQVTLKPGMFVVIPSGTNHAGLTETSGHLKFVSIKTPPQDPADVHFVP
jgi:mannose-6-phosphate isomerase-like protein (cupin superfamily)